ncbi:MAG: hypothetical protein U0401_27840 [Anaerolineae bacterium]
MNEARCAHPSIMFEAGKLSGGNLQKVVLGREVMRQPGVLVVEQPTRGLDVGATEYVQRQLLAGVIEARPFCSFRRNLRKLSHFSDRIAVMYKGRLWGVVRSGQRAA